MIGIALAAPNSQQTTRPTLHRGAGLTVLLPTDTEVDTAVHIVLAAPVKEDLISKKVDIIYEDIAVYAIYTIERKKPPLVVFHRRPEVAEPKCAVAWRMVDACEARGDIARDKPIT